MTKKTSLEQVLSTAKNTILTIGIAGGVLLGSSQKAESQTVNVVQVPNAERVRTDMFYQLPGNVNGYSFIEVYDDSHFSKTILNKEVGPHGIAIRAETAHAPGFHQAGFGPQINLPAPKNGYASIAITPLWMNPSMQRVVDRVIASYAMGVEIGSVGNRDVRLDTFGNINLATKTWDYGEADISMRVTKNVRAGIHADLLSQETMMPKTRLGINLAYNLGK